MREVRELTFEEIEQVSAGTGCYVPEPCCNPCGCPPPPPPSTKAKSNNGIGNGVEDAAPPGRSASNQTKFGSTSGPTYDNNAGR
jgi:hypothetical protein